VSDFYMNKSEWNDTVRAENLAYAKENNPGLEVESETVTCPVPGIENEDVLLFRVTFETKEPA
jgi:hypothetical protein